MRRILALSIGALFVGALAVPAGAVTKTTSEYALKGEARALELAVLGDGVTLGFALSQADSTPRALGVGAGQCTLLGDTDDPDGLPCSSENTVRSSYPGDPGSEEPSCSGTLPAPLSDVVKLNAVCGASASTFKNGVATTRSTGQIASLGVTLPVGMSLVPADLSTEEVEQVVDDLTGVLSPVLDAAPEEVRDTLEGTKGTAFETLDGLLEVIGGLDATDALKAEIGTSHSRISRSGRVLSSRSTAAGARIGLVGIPSMSSSGTLIEQADPLKNGLVIIEVGTAQASASVDRATAAATSGASPALVTVKVRDITSPEPKYVEVSVAPGETVTVLEGTPAESTIVAADSETTEEPGSASAVANAVSLHLLKGVEGGVRLGIAGTNAAATAEVNVVKSNRPPRILPQTGARDLGGLALILLVGSAITLGVRRRVKN